MYKIIDIYFIYIKYYQKEGEVMPNLLLPFALKKDIFGTFLL